MDTTLLHPNTPILGVSAASFANEDTSTQNDTVSEVEEQEDDSTTTHATHNIKTIKQDDTGAIIGSIKCEKDALQSNVNGAPPLPVNYNDLIVALWNMVEHTATVNPSPSTTTTSSTNTNNTPNTTNIRSLHLPHSTQQQQSGVHDKEEEDIDICSSRSPPISMARSPYKSTCNYRKSKMANIVTNSRREGAVPHPQVLKFCPNYVSYDARARKESKERISSHLQERQKLVIKCIELAIGEIDALGFELSAECAVFEDNGEILSRALDHLASQIDRWDGVQVKQCKKEAEDGSPILIDTWQKFAKKAKNHQDQTSWKISGDYFFAPYIARVNRYIAGYCRCIMNISRSLRSQILCLGNLSFAQNLLNGKIKFHRTKLKPLIRHRTLVKSSGIHIELENLCPKLTIRKFIQNAKAKRKQSDGKSNIIAGDFYGELIKYVQNQYEMQAKLVREFLVKAPIKPPLPLPPMIDQSFIAPPTIPLNIPSIRIPECIMNFNIKKRKRSIWTAADFGQKKRRKLEYSHEFEYILAACNGSCGNALGEWIAHIVAPNNEYNLSPQQELNVLSHKFGVCGNKMRDLFVSLVTKDGRRHVAYDDGDPLNSLIIALQNENVFISNRLCRDEEWITRFVNAFCSLLSDAKSSHIVRSVADASCLRVPHTCELLEEVQRNGININQNGLNDRYKKLKENQYYEYMKLYAQHGALTNNQMMAIMIFCDNLNVIYHNEWCKNANGCKWKQLWRLLCDAIHQIYTAFVYKNDEFNAQFDDTLYHQTPKNVNIISILYKNSMSQQCAQKLNVQNELYNGRFIAAPIDWIVDDAQHNNNNSSINFKHNTKWISLPTRL